MLERQRAALVSLHFAEYITNLASELAEKIDVLLILYQNNADDELGADWQARLKQPGLTILALPRPKSASDVLKNRRQLLTVIREFNPHVIHYQEDPRDELILSLPFLRNFPSVLTIHDPKRHTGWDAKLSRFSFYRFYFRRAIDVAITHGEQLAKELTDMYPHLKDRVWSIAHGPLGVGFAGTKPSRPEGCRILFFGRIHAYKGLAYFVDAIIALRQKGYPVVGVVAGRGSDLAPNRQRMDDSGCFEIIDRYINADDIPGLFLDSLIIALPYTDGTQSGVAAMALGFGRPVVATAVGSIPELVREGTNGLLTPARDSEKFAAALETILADPQLWEKLAQGSLDLKNGDLSWRTIADKTLLAYQAAIESKTAR